MFPRPGQLPLVDFPVPDTPTERGDEDPGRIARIDDHAVTPLEVEPGNSPPRQAAIGGPPGGGLEARSVEHTGVARVDRHVVHVLVLREDPAPCCADIGREIDAAVLRALRSAPAPGGQVQTAGGLWVDGQAARTAAAPEHPSPRPGRRPAPDGPQPHGSPPAPPAPGTPALAAGRRRAHRRADARPP